MSGAEPGEHGTPSDGADPTSLPTRVGPESEWSINWAGASVLLVLVVAALVVWRLFGAGGDDVASSSGDVGTETVATTQPPRTSTTSIIATTTVAPTTTPSTTPTTTPMTTGTPERRVLIEGDIKPCRFGDRCLVASFTLEGFEQTSGEFACIYPNSTSQFSFSDGGRDDACVTADEGDTIAIEVDGVRSAVISEQNLTGAP